MQKVLYLRHCLFTLRRTVTVASVGMDKGMRVGFVEQKKMRQQSLFLCSLVSGMW